MIIPDNKAVSEIGVFSRENLNPNEDLCKAIQNLNLHEKGRKASFYNNGILKGEAKDFKNDLSEKLSEKKVVVKNSDKNVGKLTHQNPKHTENKAEESRINECNLVSSEGPGGKNDDSLEKVQEKKKNEPEDSEEEEEEDDSGLCSRGPMQNHLYRSHEKPPLYSRSHHSGGTVVVAENAVNRSLFASSIRPQQILSQNIPLRTICLQNVHSQDITQQNILQQNIIGQNIPLQNVHTQSMQSDHIPVHNFSMQNISSQLMSPQSISQSMSPQSTSQSMSPQSMSPQSMSPRSISQSMSPQSMSQSMSPQGMSQSMSPQSMSQSMSPQSMLLVSSQIKTSQNVPLPNIPSQNIPAQNIPTQNITTHNISTQNILAQNIPTQNITTHNISTQNILAQNIPTQNITTHNISTQSILAQNIPAQNIPAQNITIQNIPAQNIPIQNIPAQNIPVQNIPIQNMPTQNIPAQNMSTQNMHAQNMPAQNMPAQNMAIQNMPHQTLSLQNLSLQNLSLQNISSEDVIQNKSLQNIPASIISNKNILASSPNIPQQNIPLQNMSSQHSPHYNVIADDPANNASSVGDHQDNTTEWDDEELELIALIAENPVVDDFIKQVIQDSGPWDKTEEQPSTDNSTVITVANTVAENYSDRDSIESSDVGKLNECSDVGEMSPKSDVSSGSPQYSTLPYHFNHRSPSDVSSSGVSSSKGSPQYSSLENESDTWFIKNWVDIHKKYKPLCPKPAQSKIEPDSARAKLLKKLDVSRRLRAWALVNVKPNEFFTKGDNDGDTHLMIYVSNKYVGHLEYIYAMVQRMRHIPNSLSQVNKALHSALYIACMQMKDEPLVPAYIAEALAEQNIDVAKLKYENGKTITEILEEKGETHKEVLKELLSVKNSRGQYIFHSKTLDTNGNVSS